MRTTLVLDDDLADSIRSLAERMNCSMREVVNRALRAGIDQVEKPAISKPYKTVPRPLGLKPGLSYDNVQELLDQIEAEEKP